MYIPRTQNQPTGVDRSQHGGLRLGFSDRLFQRRLVVRDRRATQAPPCWQPYHQIIGEFMVLTAGK